MPAALHRRSAWLLITRSSCSGWSMRIGRSNSRILRLGVSGRKLPRIRRHQNGAQQLHQKAPWKSLRAHELGGHTHDVRWRRYENQAIEGGAVGGRKDTRRTTQRVPDQHELPVRKSLRRVAGDRHQVVAEVSNGHVGNRLVASVSADVEEEHVVTGFRQRRRQLQHRGVAGSPPVCEQQQRLERL